MRSGSLGHALRVGVSENRLGRLLVLAGLCGFAITQPLLSVLGENPLVFLRTNVDGWVLVAFTLALAFVPPLVAWAVISAASALWRPLGDALFLLAIGLLSGAAAIQIAKAIGIHSPSLLALVGLMSFGGVPRAYVRHRPVADWARYTSFLPLLAVGLFLFTSPSGSILVFGNTSGAPAERSGDEPPVVMIMLDEFPTRTVLDEQAQIDGSRFPHLAEFAEDATWYRHYTAMAPFTGSSVPSILSGLEPTAERPTFREHPDTLFSLLTPTHDVRAFETASWLCNAPGCHPTGSADLAGLSRTTWSVLTERWSLSSGSSRLLDDFAEVFDERPTGAEAMGGAFTVAQPGRVAEFIDSLADSNHGDRPTLNYLHLMLPHQPWLLYPDGSRYRDADPFVSSVASADRKFGDRWSPWFAEIAEQRHSMQASYSDLLVGDILDALRRAGTYDDSLIVITSDHGVAFRLRSSQREPTMTSIGDVAYVPLLIKPPGQSDGRIDDSNLMAVDVLPTLADIIGVQPTWDVDGYPAGSAEIDQRGDVKVWVDIVDPFQPRSNGTFEYSDSESFASTADGVLGPIPEGQDAFTAWFDTLRIPEYFGRPFDDFVDGPWGSARVTGLDELREPSDPSVPVGHVTAELLDAAGAAGNAIFVLEVNGAIVAGSRVEADVDGRSHVSLLIPPGTLGEHNEIRGGLVTYLGDFEVELR